MGYEVRNVRERAGMNVEPFASLLGVSTSTAYHWEELGSKETHMDKGARRLIEALDGVCRKMTRAEARGFGEQLATLVRTRGALHALHALLRRHFERVSA